VVTLDATCCNARELRFVLRTIVRIPFTSLSSINLVFACNDDAAYKDSVYEIISGIVCHFHLFY
jgi:hypothetical protein